jgi:hypothetical protein
MPGSVPAFMTFVQSTLASEPEAIDDPEQVATLETLVDGLDAEASQQVQVELSDRLNSTALESPSDRRSSLERWSRLLASLLDASRATANTILIDYAAQARTAILIDNLGWYAEGLAWIDFVSPNVSAEARHTLEGDAGVAAIHLDRAADAQRYMERAILGAAQLRDAKSLARHFGTLAIAVARQEAFVAALRASEVALTFDSLAGDDDALKLKLESDHAVIAAAVSEAEDAEG